jgi:hypothetical protein
VIVGLHGKIGAGKNEAAKRLALISPLRVVEVSYARKLKQSVAALFGISLEDIELLKNDDEAFVWLSPALGNDVELFHQRDKRMTFRVFLQRYGTEAHRLIFGVDFWLDAALPWGGGYEDAIYAVTDVRFENEAKRVRELGGVVVGIVGPGDVTLAPMPEPTEERPPVQTPWGPVTVPAQGSTVYPTEYELALEGAPKHASERGLECDRYIDNTARDNRYASLDRQLAELLFDLGVFTEREAMEKAWDEARAYELAKTEGV